MADEIKPDIDAFVEVDEVRVHYEYFGDKTKPVVIVFNGVSMETRSWYQFLPHFGDKVDILLWDFRGQGQSSSDDQPYDICAHAGYLKAIIETLGLESSRTNLLGISSGSIVETEFLRQCSHLVHRAVLCGVLLNPEKTFLNSSDVGMRLLREGQFSIWVDSLYCNLFSSAFLELIEPFVPKMKVALTERYQSRVLALARILEAQKAYLLGIKDYYEDFKKISTPLMLVAGGYDVMTPPFVQKNVLTMFGKPVEYLEFEGAGHMIALERPQEFFGKAVEFLLKD